MEPDLHANISEKFSFLKQVQQTKNKLNIIELLKDESRICFIDTHKLYAIVETQYLYELQDIASKSTRQNEQVTKRYGEQILTVTSLSQTSLLKDGQSNKMKQNEKRLMKEIKRLKQTLKEQESIIEQMQGQNIRLVKQINLKNQYQEPKIIKNSQRYLNLSEKFIQTQYSIPVIEFTRDPEELANRNYSEKVIHNEEEEMNKLEAHFQLAMQSMKGQLEEKMRQFNQSMIDSEKWKKINSELQVENQRLREAERKLNKEEQQLRIFKEKMIEYLGNMEENIKNKSQTEQDYGQFIGRDLSIYHNPEEKIKKLEQKIFLLLTQKIKKKQELKQLSSIMEENQDQITEQNIITKLIASSEKVRELIKTILLAI